MIGKTHDLIALTSFTYVAATLPLVHLSLATFLVSLGANVAGGVAPDIDQPTAHLWHKIPAGSIIGRILCPLLGGHRLISHSLLGIALFGFGLKYLLIWMHTFLLVDMNIVWWAFMIGFVSHLVADTFTHEGVPWFFPIPIKIGIPPFKFLRIKTGGFIEKLIIFPGFILLESYIVYTHYSKFLTYLHIYIK